MIKKIASRLWKRTPRFLRLKAIRATQSKFTASVGAVVTNETGKILLLEHILRPASGWGIPGGFMNYDEQPDAAVRREIREETGLELEKVKLFRVRTINRRHLEFVFRAETSGDGQEARVLSGEITALGWFEIDEMPEEMSDVQKAIVKEVLRREV